MCVIVDIMFPPFCLCELYLVCYHVTVDAIYLIYYNPQEVLLAQFSLYVHKGGLKPDSFQYLIYYCTYSVLLPSYWIIGYHWIDICCVFYLYMCHTFLDETPVSSTLLSVIVSCVYNSTVININCDNQWVSFAEWPGWERSLTVSSSRWLSCTFLLAWSNT